MPSWQRANGEKRDDENQPKGEVLVRKRGETRRRGGKVEEVAPLKLPRN